MNILHVISDLDPGKGGPPAVAMRLTAAQAGLGHGVRLLTYGTPPTDDAVRAELRSLPHGGDVNLEMMPRGSVVERVLAHRGGRRAAAHLPHADFMHMHGVWIPLLRAAGVAARRARVPYCVRPAGALDPWSMEQRSFKKRAALAMGYRRMLQDAAFLHVLNDDESRLIEPLGLTSRREIIPNGVFLEELQPLPARGAFRAAHPELGDRPFVLFLSRLHHKKGLDHLASSFALAAPKLSGAHLVVAGPDDGEREGFERRIRDAGLSDRAHVVGPLYERRKLEALVDAARFCLPSRQEGFSVAITEALARGVPVVVTEACHFPEVAEVGAGRVVPLDDRAIAAALVEVMSSDALRANMGRRGRELIAKRFTWERIAQRTIEAYERVVE